MANTTSAIDVAYKVIIEDNPAAEPKTFMGFTPSSISGLVRELLEDDGDSKETFAPGIAIEMPYIEIGIKGEPEDYEGPRNEAIKIRRLLTRVRDYQLNDVKVQCFAARGGIMHLGRDENRRTMFGLRFQAYMEVPA